uniref:Uncharacterized protein n=1 Tax=Romanomermis culicivorax TaxID=13658 RepID=A0A915JBQ7_ROMCU
MVFDHGGFDEYGDFLVEGVFDRGEFIRCGHFTEKDYPGCKQAYFRDFLVEGVIDRDCTQEIILN